MSKKRYYVDNLVEVWQRDWFEADSDEEAIALAETGDYIPTEHQVLDDYNYYIKTFNGKNYVFELYDDQNNIIKRHEREEMD